MRGVLGPGKPSRLTPPILDPGFSDFRFRAHPWYDEGWRGRGSAAGRVLAVKTHPDELACTELHVCVDDHHPDGAAVAAGDLHSAAAQTVRQTGTEKDPLQPAAAGYLKTQILVNEALILRERREVLSFQAMHIP
jgi:hypothetical protein